MPDLRGRTHHQGSPGVTLRCSECDSVLGAPDRTTWQGEYCRTERFTCPECGAVGWRETTVDGDVWLYRIVED